MKISFFWWFIVLKPGLQNFNYLQSIFLSLFSAFSLPLCFSLSHSHSVFLCFSLSFSLCLYLSFFVEIILIKGNKLMLLLSPPFWMTWSEASSVCSRITVTVTITENYFHLWIKDSVIQKQGIWMKTSFFKVLVYYC